MCIRSDIFQAAYIDYKQICSALLSLLLLNCPSKPSISKNLIAACCKPENAHSLEVMHCISPGQFLGFGLPSWILDLLALVCFSFFLYFWFLVA